MGEVKRPLPVKLIVGMIAAKVDLFLQAQEKLSQQFGIIDFESRIIPFTHTDHYEMEIGKNLKRKFVSFSKLIAPEDIADVKIFTNDLEKQFLYPGSRRRQVNLDPGYMEAAKLVLATTKNHQHRIYLGKGIYGEITLRYTKKSFRAWEWTYPDYRTEDYLQIFNCIRKLYLESRDVSLSLIPSFGGQKRPAPANPCPGEANCPARG